jgi:hypothetical protein
MSQPVKTKRQAGAFKGLVEQKKLAHSCQKKPNLHTKSLNKLLFRNDFHLHFTF